MNKVSADLQSLDESKTRRERLGRLRTRCQQLENALQRLQTARRYEEILVKIIGSLPKTPHASKSLTAKPNELRVQLEKDWVAFTTNNDVQIRLMQPLENFTEKLSAYLNGTWQKHLGIVMPDLAPNRVNTLRNAGFRDDAARLEELHYKLTHAKRQLPDSTDVGDRISEWAREAKEIIKNLEGLPEPVKHFLAKASKSGTAIEELTPEIRNWLASKDLLDLLVIKTRS